VRAALLLAAFALGCGPPARRAADAAAGSDGPTGDTWPGLLCSKDLHDVTDAQGHVVTHCPDDQGCAGGACIVACDAAAASQGSVGCDFIAAVPSTSPITSSPCYAVFLANNWKTDAAITIARDGASYDPHVIGRVPDGTPDAASWPAVAATGLAPAGVAVLFLSSDPSAQNGGNALTCPIPPAVGTKNGAVVWSGFGWQSGRGKAFHIHTSVPVSAYDILPYGGASSYLPSASLLLPTTAWGTSYVAMTPTVSLGPAWGQVIAARDGTTVEVSPTVALPAGTGVAAAAVNSVTQYQLNAGEILEWEGQDMADMSGSSITSNQPIAFVGGTGMLCLSSATSAGGGCDAAHQPIAPLSAQASEYVAMPYTTRRADLQPESIRYRVIASVAGTQLVYAPAPPGAPAVLGAGQVGEFEATGAFTITSQDDMHPFQVAQYMSGCSVTSGSRSGDPKHCLGDEEFVTLVPPAQWLPSYVFFTDPSYTTTNLVLVRERGPDGAFADVVIDCLGPITGWEPIAGGGRYELANIDLQRDVPIGTCRNGGHTATSTAPFTLVVWGLSYCASYAYPAGGNVGKLNSVVIL
jgi:hypothetical protein